MADSTVDPYVAVGWTKCQLSPNVIVYQRPLLPETICRMANIRKAYWRLPWYTRLIRAIGF